jgi:hypothetical protein
MNTSKFAIATLTGGMAFFFLGFLAYAVVFESFFVDHAGTATGVMNTEMVWWPLILGNLAHAALLTYIFMKWANITTFGSGINAGATIGFLISLGFDMITYDTTNIIDLTGAIVDVFIYTVMCGIVGGIIGWILGRGIKD